MASLTDEDQPTEIDPRPTLKTAVDPTVADAADGVLPGYDEQNLVTYPCLLDAAKKGASWQDVAKIVLRG